MNFKTLLMPMAATMLLVGCTNEDELDPNGPLGEPQYLTVNLVTNSTNTTKATRAPGDQVNGDPNATYEEGLDAENKVTKVRFYFFDASGNAAHVRNDNGTLRNYLDWTDISEENTDMPNVEQILTATLVIQSPQGDGRPAQMVAIVNPTTDPVEERSLTSLTTVANPYHEYTSSGSFVMSNSTYADGGAVKMAVSVEDKIYKKSAEALNDPVQIHVERTVAKVRLNSSLSPVSGTTNIFPTSADGSQKVNLDGTDTEIYVKFLGWNTTAVADKSRLVKHIIPTWPDNLFGAASTPWNWSNFFRSFWAVNADGVTYRYGAFVPDNGGSSIDDNYFQAQAKRNFNRTDWVYVNENATDNAKASSGDNPGTPTKVIISAQLVDKNGNPLEFAEYGSTRTTIDGLKKLFANNCGLYKKVNEGGNEKFVKIAPEDLTIKTATEIGVAGKNVDGRYKVYVQLAADEDNKWYASNSESAKTISASVANAQLKGLGSAKVWKDGYTYYYFDISHFGNKIGVVRNHIYDANITKLTGLGTPVYKPEEIIYPEKPDDDNDTFIAAQINILSWRIVSSDVELNW